MSSIEVWQCNDCGKEVKVFKYPKDPKQVMPRCHNPQCKSYERFNARYVRSYPCDWQGREI